MFEQILEAVKVVGFPIVCCGWFMFANNKRMDKLIDLVGQLVNENCEKKDE